jgi:hypothetical protein
MRKKNYLALFIAILPFMTAFKSDKVSACQGIEGHVYWIAGNQMPSPDVKPAEPKGFKTTLYIYELTNLNQTVRMNHSTFYSAIHTRLIAKTESGKDGYFRLKLPVGRYSIFVKKDDLFFANWFDGNNNISPVEVSPDKLTRIDIKVDYEASY